MRLLDMLEEYQDHRVDDGGAAFAVEEYIAEWEAGAEAGDRGPKVVCLPGEDGCLRLVAGDARGAAEIVAVLVPRGGSGDERAKNQHRQQYLRRDNRAAVKESKS